MAGHSIGREHVVGAAEEFVAAIAAEAKRQGVPHECFYIRSASVADGIVKTATERGCDLICMGSQGRRGLAGLLLGSDTVDVLNSCTIPLLVYR